MVTVGKGLVDVCPSIFSLHTFTQPYRDMCQEPLRKGYIEMARSAGPKKGLSTSHARVVALINVVMRHAVHEKVWGFSYIRATR